jgi:predicted nucleic acid-binding protein
VRAIFIDTGAFLAKEIAADQYHRQAVEFWDRIVEEAPILYSSEHVLDETATLLARRTSYYWATEWGADVLNAGIHFLPTQGNDLQDAFHLMRKYADQAVTLTDCISFVLMKKEGLRDAFGFDRHFAAAGYRLWPSATGP